MPVITIASGMSPNDVVAATTNVRKAPRTTVGEADQSPPEARAVGADAVPAVRDDVVVERVLDVRQLGRELVLEVGQLHVGAAREQRREELLFVGEELGFALVEAHELVVGLGPALGELLDRDEAAHREVDDRRGDVEQVRLLVDERADLARAHLVGRYELDGARVLLAQRDALLLAGHVAQRGVDRGAGPAPVATAPVGEHAHGADAEHRQEAGRRRACGR